MYITLKCSKACEKGIKMKKTSFYIQNIIIAIPLIILMTITSCKPTDNLTSSSSASLSNVISESEEISSDVQSSDSTSNESVLSISDNSSTSSSFSSLPPKSIASSSISSSITSKPYVKPIPPDVELAQKGSILQISETANIDKLNGFGTEWDPHFWMPYNTKYETGESDWKTITDRILEIGIDRVRVMWLPMWHEITNDNGDPAIANMDMFFFNENNKELASLKRQLDFCQKNGIKVTLAYWGPTRQSWIGSKYEGNWWNAPYSDDEYVENIAILLKYLTVTCKYSVVDEFCSFNEPSLGYYNKDGKIVFAEYRDMMRKLDTRLKNDGIRNKVRLIASDDSSSRGNIGSGEMNGLNWFEKNAIALKITGDVFSTHSYRFLLEDSNEDIVFDMKAYFDILKKYSPNKPLMVHEFGTSNYADAYHVNDLETYARALMLPKFAVNLLNAGGAGALYWILYDQLYYEGAEKDAKMSTGLWGFKTENWRIRKMYHSWGLLTKYTSADSLIYKGQSEDPDLCIAALKDKKGLTTYLIVNTAKNSKQFTIKTPVTKLAYFDKYVFDKTKASSASDKLTGPDQRIPCSKNTIVGEIGAESFIVLREA